MVERPLRILQVSTADIQGGAERVAWNLLNAYRAYGQCAWIAVGVKRSDDPDILAIPNQESRGKWYHFFHHINMRLQKEVGGIRSETPLSHLAGVLAEPVRRYGYYRGIEDFHFPGTNRLLELVGQAPDILHLHNLHGAYFDLRKLPWLCQQVPVWVTMHDAWMLSGHCAHSFECEKWKTGCGDCPDLTIYPSIERDATAYNWARKRDIYARSRLYLATPSRWLMQKVNESMMLPAVAESRVIPNGVDTSIFRPANRREVRSQLGIDQDARVLLTLGASNSKWKDYRLLQDIFNLTREHLAGINLLLIVLGEEAPGERIGQAEIQYVPFRKDEKEVARYYQAADIFVHPTFADTFPLSILESIACGTPVVASAVGGIPEQIDEGQTGFLLAAGDTAGFAPRVQQLILEEELRLNMGERGVEAIRHRFRLDQQVHAYLEWYREILCE